MPFRFKGRFAFSPGVYFTDSFNRADGALSDPWVGVNNTNTGAPTFPANISSNKLITTGATAYYSAPDTGSQNHFARCDYLIATTTNGNRPWMVRYTDALNNLSVRWLSGKYDWIQRLAGVTTTVKSTTAAQPALGARTEISASGTTATLKVNGVVVDTCPIDAGLMGTRVGFACVGSVHGDLLDNWESGPL